MPESRLPGLDDLLTKALAQSPQMLARSVDLARAAAGRISAHAALYPSVNGNGRYADIAVSTTGTPNSTRVGLDYTLSVGMPIFHWGELKANAKWGDLDQEISQKRYAQAYRDLVGQVRTLYLRLILQKRSLANRERAVALMAKAMAYDRQRLKSGQLTDAEFAGTQANFDEAQLGLDRDRLAFSTSLAGLAQLTGLKEVSAADVPDELPAPSWDAAQAQALATYFDQTQSRDGTPEVRVVKDQIQQSELRYKVAKVRLLPKFDLTAATMEQSQTYLMANRVIQSGTRQQWIGVQANWSIFDGFATRGAKLQALADRRANELQLQNLVANLDEQKREDVAQCELSARALELAERRLSFAKGSVHYLEAEAKANRASSAQVDDATTNLLNAELTAMSARADLYQRWSDLVGLLWMDPALDRVPATYLKNGH